MYSIEDVIIRNLVNYKNFQKGKESTIYMGQSYGAGKGCARLDTTTYSGRCLEFFQNGETLWVVVSNRAV